MLNTTAHYFLVRLHFIHSLFLFLLIIINCFIFPICTAYTILPKYVLIWTLIIQLLKLRIWYDKLLFQIWIFHIWLPKAPLSRNCLPTGTGKSLFPRPIAQTSDTCWATCIFFHNIFLQLHLPSVCPPRISKFLTYLTRNTHCHILKWHLNL